MLAGNDKQSNTGSQEAREGPVTFHSANLEMRWQRGTAPQVQGAGQLLVATARASCCLTDPGHQAISCLAIRSWEMFLHQLSAFGGSRVV